MSQEGQAAQPSENTLVAARHEWHDHLLLERRLSAHTVAAYGSDIDAFLAFLAQHLGEAPTLSHLEHLGARDIRAYLAKRRRGDTALTDRSLARALASMRAFFGFLDRRLGIANPAIALVRGPKLKAGLPRPVSPDQAFDIIEHAQEQGEPWIGARDCALFTLLYGCGLRISEALSLTGASAPLPPVLTIVGKGNKTRHVPTLPIAQDALLEYGRLCPYGFTRDGPLFFGARGGPLRARLAQLSLARMRGALGLP
ncbi:MAG: hypothetical protein RL186_1453, partial [Pseudomonadota bacterium]